ncbi:hypothetical protein ACQVP2_33845 [Methylobacterium aquaticum]|uniref:hypothetical protein n=1 Tax=Methylobacterium aquaticum TaxID=270351 RepID=UPI003D177B51
MKIIMSISFVIITIIIILFFVFTVNSFRLNVFQTSVNPNILGITGSTSLSIITLSLKNEKIRVGGSEIIDVNQYKNIDYEINFKIPAAYVTKIIKKSKNSKIELLGFEFWSKTLDPVFPDWQKMPHSCRLDFCTAGIFVDRREKGEVALDVELSNMPISREEQQKNLLLKSGIIQTKINYNKPCKIEYNEKLNFITIDKPSNIKSYRDACNFIAGERYQGNDNAARPRHFAKKNSDNDIEYIVECDRFSETPKVGSLCVLHGFFGVWPLFIRVEPSRIKYWNDYYLTSLKFLAKYVESRTDIISRAGAE